MRFVAGAERKVPDCIGSGGDLAGGIRAVRAIPPGCGRLRAG